jgi:hypothetical protein
LRPNCETIKSQMSPPIVTHDNGRMLLVSA